jgi:hypothetical protein
MPKIIKFSILHTVVFDNSRNVMCLLSGRTLIIIVEAGDDVKGTQCRGAYNWASLFLRDINTGT